MVPLYLPKKPKKSHITVPLMIFFVLEARIVTRGHLCLLLSYSLPVTLASVLFNLPRILSLFPIGSLLQVS